MDERWSLAGRSALVTGATRGIGRAIAFNLARRGATLVVCSRKAAAVEETVAELRSETGANAHGLVANVGRLEDCARILAEAPQLVGTVEILVNNAAANPVFGGLAEVTAEAYAKIMDVNVRAPIELSKGFLGGMKALGRGAIVNVSSIGGMSPENGLGVYSASKAALISLTRTMAREWGGFGIRANAVCPGFIKTDFSKTLWSNDEVIRDVLGSQPLPRLGTADEIAELVGFLASDAASFCTGGVYLADGGYLA